MSDAASETEKHCEGGRLLDEQAQAFELWIFGEREQIMVFCDKDRCRTGERCRPDDLVILIANRYGTGKLRLDNDRITPDPALKRLNDIRRHTVLVGKLGTLECGPDLLYLIFGGNEEEFPLAPGFKDLKRGTSRCDHTADHHIRVENDVMHFEYAPLDALGVQPLALP